MLNDAFLALIFFFPAAIANATPVIASKIPFLKKWEYPMDFYISVNGVRVFGDHKTMRGLVCGTLIAILTTYLLSGWYQQFDLLKNINPLIFGSLAALGALLGDAIKSFFKRRSNIKPGDAWFPFDQLDYIIGGTLLLAPYVSLNIVQYMWVFLIYFGMHLISTYIGFLLKLKSKPI